MGNSEMKTIVVVDDEQDIVDTLYDIFMDDYNVMTALSGSEALKIIEQEKAALVISDQRMPEMTGTELLSKIDAVRPICKKILLTGYADINAAIDAINHGHVDKYLNKPWDDDELQKAVKNLLDDYETDELIQSRLDAIKKMKSEGQGAKELVGIYEKFLNNFRKGIMIVDENGTVKFVNSKGLNILAKGDLTQVQGRSFIDFFPLDDPDLKSIYASQQETNTCMVAGQATNLKGEEIPVKMRVLFDQDSDKIMVVGCIFSV